MSSGLEARPRSTEPGVSLQPSSSPGKHPNLPRQSAELSVLPAVILSPCLSVNPDVVSEEPEQPGDLVQLRGCEAEVPCAPCPCCPSDKLPSQRGPAGFKPSLSSLTRTCTQRVFITTHTHTQGHLRGHLNKVPDRSNVCGSFSQSETL